MQQLTEHCQHLQRVRHREEQRDEMRLTVAAHASNRGAEIPAAVRAHAQQAEDVDGRHAGLVRGKVRLAVLEGHRVVHVWRVRVVLLRRTFAGAHTTHTPLKQAYTHARSVPRGRAHA